MLALLGDEALEQVPAVGGQVLVVEGVLVVLEAVLLPLLEGLQGRGGAERLGGPFDQLGEGAPGARALGGLAAVALDVVPEGVRGIAVVALERVQVVEERLAGELVDRLPVGLDGRHLAPQQAVESLGVGCGAGHSFPPIRGSTAPAGENCKPCAVMIRAWHERRPER